MVIRPLVCPISYVVNIFFGIKPQLRPCTCSHTARLSFILGWCIAYTVRHLFIPANSQPVNWRDKGASGDSFAMSQLTTAIQIESYVARFNCLRTVAFQTAYAHVLGIGKNKGNWLVTLCDEMILYFLVTPCTSYLCVVNFRVLVYIAYAAAGALNLWSVQR